MIQPHSSSRRETGRARRLLGRAIRGDHEARGLVHWRERILTTLLGTGLVIGLIVVIPSALMAVQEHLWWLLLGHASAFGAAAVLFFHRTIPYTVKATATLIVCYGIGVFVVSNVGPLSGGPAYLFCFAVLAGVLLGVRAAALAVGVNGLTLIVLGAMMLSGTMGTEGVQFVTSMRALVAGFNFMLLNAVAAVSVAVLVRGLETMSRHEQEAAASLRAERAELIRARENLRAEVVERCRIEESLRESEARYRFFTESINDAIWVLGLDFRYTYISPAAEKIQGWPPDVIMKMPMEEIMTPDSLKAAMDIFAEQMALGEDAGDYQRSKIFEVELYRADGSTVWSEVTASFLLGEDGKPVSILGVTRDITERLQAQQEKEDLQYKLARARKMEALGLLAGGVAHDLNNILSGVLSYPELLLMDLPPDSRLRKPLETIRDSGQRAAAVVSDLITVARGVASQRDVLDPGDLARRFLDGPEFGTLKQGHADVTVTLKSQDDRLNVKGSAVHLEKALMNLVANAVEAVEKSGEVTIVIENRYLDKPLKGIGESAKGEYVVLSVADNGPGISTEDRERIFEPFYTRKIMGRSGTGLGLTVVWNTVRDHDGFIDVRTGDWGTVFDLYLPASRERAKQEKTSGALDELRGNGETILIVDDEPAQREIAGEILSRMGYRVHSVDSGEAALAHLRRESVELLLLDMMMPPGINGRETYQQAVALRPGQKAILASGYSETADVRAAQRLGAGKYLRKPYTIDALAQAVQEELARGSR